MQTQVQLLLRYAREDLQLNVKRLTIVYGAQEPFVRIAHQYRAEGLQGRKVRIASLSELRANRARIAQQSARNQVQGFVTLLHGSELVQLLRWLSVTKATVHVLIPGLLGSEALSHSSFGRNLNVHLCYPTSAKDHQPQGIREFLAVAERHNLPKEHVAVQIRGFLAARIFFEGLARTGSELYREKLVDALETFYQFETGLSPAISYSPNRRLGTSGCYVAELNSLERRTKLQAWIELDTGQKDK